MSVPSGLRDLSKMEYYKNAVRIRTLIDEWLIREFGLKKSYRSVRQVIKNITEDDQKLIDSIFEKYSVNLNKTYNGEYPEWYIKHEQELIAGYTARLVLYIIVANKLNPTLPFEWEERRKQQNLAISQVQIIYTEIAHIKEIFNVSIKFTEDLLKALDREESLLKGWRQSDNKRRKEKQGDA